MYLINKRRHIISYSLCLHKAKFFFLWLHIWFISFWHNDGRNFAYNRLYTWYAQLHTYVVIHGVRTHNALIKKAIEDRKTQYFDRYWWFIYGQVLNILISMFTFKKFIELLNFLDPFCPFLGWFMEKQNKISNFLLFFSNQIGEGPLCTAMFKLIAASV